MSQLWYISNRIINLKTRKGEKTMDNNKSSFDKIIGYESVKKELLQLCDIMLNPEIYKQFGIKLPNGLIFFGEPGLGKSLMAKCLCEESSRAVYIVRKTKANGDFIKEMQELFNQAKENVPSIVLLDDMDKFANEDQNHPDAEEYVAVQACIDEAKDSDVFIIATVNDKNKLPESLLRAGRFDRQITVSTPTMKDATKIIEHYLGQKQSISDDICIGDIANMMYGKSCADLERIVNEAGINAAYNRKDKIYYQDIIDAYLRTAYNSTKRIEDRDVKINIETAYHEAGHAVVSEILQANSVSLVSIAAYDCGTRGITVFHQDENYMDSFTQMENRIMMLIAGRISVEMNCGNYDTGADEDYRRATNVVRKMVQEYDIFGINPYHEWDHRRAENTTFEITQLVRAKLSEYAYKTRSILTRNREYLERLVKQLLEKGTITGKDIQQIK